MRIFPKIPTNLQLQFCFGDRFLHTKKFVNLLNKIHLLFDQLIAHSIKLKMEKGLTKMKIDFFSEIILQKNLRIQVQIYYLVINFPSLIFWIVY